MKLFKSTLTRTVPVSEIPEGTYQGHMSGYTVEFYVSDVVLLSGFGGLRTIKNDNHYKVSSPTGVRGIKVPCTVTVRDGELYLDLVEEKP